jgi:hypothetical protein
MINIYRLENDPIELILKGTYNKGIVKINGKNIEMSENEVKLRFSRGYWRWSEI